MSILFHSLNTSKRISQKTEIKNWLKTIISDHSKIPGEINVIFVDDDKILEINRDYLKHNCFTDIITFNYNNENIISGDIFISLDRIEENSSKYNCSFKFELLRVICHGILHLLGYDDNTQEQKKQIRLIEDKTLQMFPVSGIH